MVAPVAVARLSAGGNLTDRSSTVRTWGGARRRSRGGGGGARRRSRVTDGLPRHAGRSGVSRRGPHLAGGAPRRRVRRARRWGRPVGRVGVGAARRVGEAA